MTRRRLLLVIGLGLALAAASCVVLPWIDPHDDMERRLDDLGTPEGFEMIARERSGARVGFFGRFPRVGRTYAAEWDDTLCERLADWMRSFGSVEEFPAPREISRQFDVDKAYAAADERRGLGQGCAYGTRIPSSLRAKFINVWSYALGASVRTPVAILREQRIHDCPASRKRAAGSLLFRYAPCWVPAGQAMVEIALSGKTGF